MMQISLVSWGCAGLWKLCGRGGGRCRSWGMAGGDGVNGAVEAVGGGGLGIVDVSVLDGLDG